MSTDNSCPIDGYNDQPPPTPAPPTIETAPPTFQQESENDHTPEEDTEIPENTQSEYSQKPIDEEEEEEEDDI